MWACVYASSLSVFSSFLCSFTWIKFVIHKAFVISHAFMGVKITFKFECLVWDGSNLISVVFFQDLQNGSKSFQKYFYVCVCQLSVMVTNYLINLKGRRIYFGP
jgi:hypothetical protein